MKIGMKIPSSRLVAPPLASGRAGPATRSSTRRSISLLDPLEEPGDEVLLVLRAELLPRLDDRLQLLLVHCRDYRTRVQAISAIVQA